MCYSYLHSLRIMRSNTFPIITNHWFNQCVCSYMCVCVCVCLLYFFPLALSWWMGAWILKITTINIFSNLCNVELYYPSLMTMFYGWNRCCSTFHRHLRAASLGVISPAVRWLPERPLLQMPYIDGYETLNRIDFNHRHGYQARKTVLHNASVKA